MDLCPWSVAFTSDFSCVALLLPPRKSRMLEGAGIKEMLFPSALGQDSGKSFSVGGGFFMENSPGVFQKNYSFLLPAMVKMTYFGALRCENPLQFPEGKL